MKHVVIVGGGFGGLAAAKALADVEVRVTLIDRHNHHVFQPLLYQVATAGLSPADITAPIRAVLTSPRASVMLASVTGVDTDNKRVSVSDVHGARQIDYDYLVVATGVRHGYFGHDEWEKLALGLKSVEDAVALRRKILLAFEAAETETDDARVDDWLTFVIVGGGPTGVELAGAIAELARRVVAKDFRRIDPRRARVVLVEAGERLLPMLTPELSQSAKEQLAAMGVVVKTNVRVLDISATCAKTSEGELGTRTILWAAGVKASPAGQWLAAKTDPQGRVKVDTRCRVPGKDGVFVIGDTSTVEGMTLPGIAPVAMQQGRYVAELIEAAIEATIEDSDDAIEAHGTFRYVDKGNLATIGRGRAVGEYKDMRFTGVVAWLVWALVHVYYLIGFRSRAVVLFEWVWAYVTFQRGARLIIDTPEK